jgi:uncharacterized protein (DUF4415 family)
MSKALTKNSSADKPVKVSEKTRTLYRQRNKSLDKDPDCPTLPLEKWANAKRGVFFRPVKKPVTIRIDADVLAWLQASGAGYQTRLNQILREQMEAEQRKR